jgi:hypothetical protein
MITRRQIEAEVERLLTILDAMDGDPDLEPSLGSYNPQTSACDCEYQCDDEGDESDSGIGDADGLAATYSAGCLKYPLLSFGSIL